jgi:hypothetical protein
MTNNCEDLMKRTIKISSKCFHYLSFLMLDLVTNSPNKKCIIFYLPFPISVKRVCSVVLNSKSGNPISECPEVFCIWLNVFIML